MQSSGIGLRDYERLPSEVKSKATMMLEALKADLRQHGFALNFLGHDGLLKDLVPWKFIALSEDHYVRLIGGAKWVRPRPREDMLEQISKLYDLVKQSPKLEDRSLEFWSKEVSSS